MRDRSQQVYFNSGLLSPWRGGLLETTPAEAWLGVAPGAESPTRSAHCPFFVVQTSVCAKEHSWSVCVPVAYTRGPPAQSRTESPILG